MIAYQEYRLFAHQTELLHASNNSPPFQSRLHTHLADAMLKIHAADEENANYGRIRMFQALQYQNEIGELGEVTIPSEGIVRKIMEQIHLIHKPNRNPNGITKADREARKSDDLLKRDFTADAPLQKCVTDITEIPAKDGKLYVSAIFDCYDLLPVGLAVFHELLEQPQDLLGDWWYSTSCKTAKILRSGCRRTLCFIILVGNVSSVIDNFISMQIKEQKGFQVLPKRWVVERTFAWLNGSRRLSKDYETSCCSAETMIMISHAATLLKRL